MAGQKVLDDEARTRKEMLIEKLREAGGSSLNFATDAGSAQAQILQAEVQSRDPNKLSQADALEREIQAEDKAAQMKVIEIAQEQVTELKKLNKKMSKNNNTTRGIDR